MELKPKVEKKKKKKKIEKAYYKKIPIFPQKKLFLYFR